MTAMCYERHEVQARIPPRYVAAIELHSRSRLLRHEVRLWTTKVVDKNHDIEDEGQVDDDNECNHLFQVCRSRDDFRLVGIARGADLYICSIAVPWLLLVGLFSV